MYGYEQDIKDIKDWLKRNKVAVSTLGQAALFRTGGAKRVLEGRSTVSSLDKVLRYISKYPTVRNPSRGK
jgi:hypothetical protein